MLGAEERRLRRMEEYAAYEALVVDQERLYPLTAEILGYMLTELN